ncbi:phage tail protein [Herbaspirillum sp. alder98]|uniref:phage tail protein n=1 Tax=Herbaspirillum sp. alder98 TaxID=2913096 RepID=UPI001CD83394|nr:tail fiber protein [Herbaspirillum sp. alder98]MCA1326902.1 tail fiber protein [Herbaspirillum sp. alder98]
MAFIGEIQLFSFGYAPPGWVACNGTLLQTKDFSALFSLIGNSYGGDGKSNFRVPNLSARAACGQGQWRDQSMRKIGDAVGVNHVTLEGIHAPKHNHGLNFFNIPTSIDPDTGKVIDNRANVPVEGYSLAVPDTPMFVKDDQLSTMTNTMDAFVGGGDSHENRQPFTALDYYILAAAARSGAVFPTFD